MTMSVTTCNYCLMNYQQQQQTSTAAATTTTTTTTTKTKTRINMTVIRSSQVSLLVSGRIPVGPRQTSGAGGGGGSGGFFNMIFMFFCFAIVMMVCFVLMDFPWIYSDPQVRCTARGGNPAPSLMWRLGDAWVEAEPTTEELEEGTVRSWGCFSDIMMTMSQW